MNSSYDLIAIENFLWTPHIQTSLEILIKNKLRKKAFCYLDIDNPDNPDIPNNRFRIFGKKRIISKITKILIEHNIDIIKIPLKKNNFFELNKQNLKLKKFNDLVNLKIDGYNIGYGIASSIVDKLKKRDPNIKDIKKNTLNKYILTTSMILSSLKEIYKIYKPKAVLTFNGRFAHSSIIKNFCYKKKINTFFHERSDDMSRYYLNSRPVHDMQAWREDAIKTWKSSIIGQKKKYQIGEKWFLNRQKNKFSDGLNHRKHQLKGKIPFFKKKDRVITFFSHSDDEYAYCQELKHPIFKSQRESIIWLLKYFKNKKNVQFVLRLHPNLLNKSKSDINWWHNINKKYNYKNLKLIKSSSDIDTYALIKRSSLAITFCSSSTALESTFLGTPSIVVGDSQYRSTDSVHHPMNLNQLKKLINKENIKPKPKKNALKFSFYRSTYGIKYKYYKPYNNFEGKIFGNKFNYYPEFILYLKKLIN